jgi:hypothetical protein
VRAGCGDKPHVRFGRGRLMLLSHQGLASYLTSWKSRSTRARVRDARHLRRVTGDLIFKKGKQARCGMLKRS